MKLDDKTVIHDYGHGGAGHSLGWGTGYLVTERALEHETREVAVIGCGTVGLTAARQLQRHGFAVTIYAMAVPPDTTSNMALAGFTPTSGLVDGDKRTAAWDAQFRRAAVIAYQQLQALVGRGYGVSWIYSYRFMNEVPQRRPANTPLSPLLPDQIRTPEFVLYPGEHPFPSRYAGRQPSLRIEPSIYLDALVRDFLDFGGKIVIRKFDTLQDFMTLSETLIVNCTGLGSRTLFSDDELTPLKGQLTFLVPQAEVDYATFGGIPGRDQTGFVHMMPRSDGIALGGTAEEGVWDLNPNEDAMRRIVETHIELFAAMRPMS
jgi:D-amino-acid oxidase